MTVLRPLVVLAPLLAATADPHPATATDLVTLPLLDLDAPARASLWRPVHDRVMGGVSTGRAAPAPGAVRFEGEVSLEKGGGFASFRHAGELPDLAGRDGLRLRVRGDGRTWKLSLRTDGARDAVSWQAPFATAAPDGDDAGEDDLGPWTTVDLAFEDLAPTWRGRLVRDVPPLEPGDVRQLGLLLADGQAGAYALELAAVEAWRAPRRDG